MARTAYIRGKAPQTPGVWQAGNGHLDNNRGAGTSGDARGGGRWRTACGQCGWLCDAVCAQRAVGAGYGRPLLVLGRLLPAAPAATHEPAIPGFRHVLWHAQSVSVDTVHSARVERVPHHHTHQ